MNIYSKENYPANKLSNFCYYEFYIDNIHCNSMEGFLQSLKFKNIQKQKEICLLIGFKAKKSGYNQKWWLKQELYWNNKIIKRNSEEYQILLNNAYNALYQQNPNFRKALKDTNKEILTHSIGKKDITKTILTEDEFCIRLMALRDFGE